MQNIYDLKTPNEIEKEDHTASKIQPDTLFHFMENVDWLTEMIKDKCINARYCVEDVSYLKLAETDKIAYPMKCFCDIKFHDLHEHIGFYGANGIAFPKHWGMKRSIQPVHYINPQSKMRKDFTEAFNKALQEDGKDQSDLQFCLKNYLIHELMYYKPYSGRIQNEKSEIIDKCFTDECEWRYVPIVSDFNFDQIIFFDESKRDYICKLNASLKALPEAALHFDYSDIKYLIVENQDNFIKLLDTIMNLPISQQEQHMLSSKIIIWNDAKGDF